MEKKNSNYTPYLQDLEKGGAIFEKIQKGDATEEEKIQAKELVWTFTCKILLNQVLENIPMQQKELARLINVKPTMITAYKKGKTLPSLPTLMMMISVLKPELMYALTDGKIDEVNAMLKQMGIDLFM